MTPGVSLNAGLFVVRAVLGIVFLGHGFDKVGDLTGTEQYFDSLGIPAPGLMAPVATFTEIIGGALLILGLLTPLVCVGLAVDMAIALISEHAPDGFFSYNGGYEYVLVLGIVLLSLIATGPGAWSLDAALKVPWLRPVRG